MECLRNAAPCCAGSLLIAASGCLSLYLGQSMIKVWFYEWGYSGVGIPTRVGAGIFAAKLFVPLLAVIALVVQLVRRWSVLHAVVVLGAFLAIGVAWQGAGVGYDRFMAGFQGHLGSALDRQELLAWADRVMQASKRVEPGDVRAIEAPDWLAGLYPDNRCSVWLLAGGRSGEVRLYVKWGGGMSSWGIFITQSEIDMERLIQEQGFVGRLWHNRVLLFLG
jgi:hypothetical protein